MFQILLRVAFLAVVLRLVAAVLVPDVFRRLESARMLRVFERTLGPIVQDPEVARIGMRLAAIAGVRARFRVLENTVPNAVSFPDGTVLITRGLLALLDGDRDRVAAVLAHEIAHLRHDHYLRRLGLLSLLSALVLLTRGLGAPLLRVLTRNLLMAGFSRRHELQADETALELLASAGYRPEAAAEALEALEGYTPHGPTLLATHPDPAVRAARIRARLGGRRVNRSKGPPPPEHREGGDP